MNRSRLRCALGLLLLAGCQGDRTSPPPPSLEIPVAQNDRGEPTSVAEADDAQAVAALQALQAVLKRDGEGSVTEVDLRETTIDDAALTHLAGLRRLRSVTLAGTGVTDAGLETLGTISTLQALDLRECKITNAGPAHLAGLTNLRTLRLSGKDGGTTVDDEGLVALAKLTKLKVLGLDFLWVSEKGLEGLGELQDLEELYLAQTLVDDGSLATLARFPRLKKLRISKTQVTGEGLTHLAKLTQLEELDLSECSQLEDDGLARLSGMTQLTRLNLWRVQIGDAGVAHLAGLTNLQWLNLDNTMLTNAGLKALTGMNRLTFLHLGSTAVSDAGLQQLESLTALKDLKVTRTPVTAEGVAALKKKLPHTEIQLQYIEGQ